MNEIGYMIIVCALMNSFTACYLYPKYHIKVFIIYSLLLPVCVPVIYYQLDKNNYFSPSSILFGVLCIIHFSIMFCFFVFCMKKQSQNRKLSIKRRTLSFLCSLVLNFIYFLMSGGSLLYNFFDLARWLSR